MHGTASPGPIATTPGLGNQIVAASQGNPTVDQVIERLRAIPQVKKAYNNAGLTTRQGVLSELALMLTAKAYQNSQQNPGAPAITPAMAANLALYQQYSGQLMAWQSEITGQGPVVDPDMVGVAGAYPDNIQLQNNLDVQQPGNINAAQGPRHQAAGQRERGEGSRHAAGGQRERGQPIPTSSSRAT